MKCPYCEYTHGWTNVEDKDGKMRYQNVDGGNGDFYSLSNGIVAERNGNWDKDQEPVHFCPKCGKAFIHV